MHPHANTKGKVLNKSMEGGRYTARGWRLRAEPRWRAYSLVRGGGGGGVGVMEERWRWRWRWRWRSEGGIRGGRLTERRRRMTPCAVERGWDVGEYRGLLCVVRLIVVVWMNDKGCTYGSSRRI